MHSILTVIGTRPEVIKLAPVILEIKKNGKFKQTVCVTRQHTHFVDQFLNELDIQINYELHNQDNKNFSLHQSAARILENIEHILKKEKPDLVIVQGDTTTAFSAALAAFYSGIPVAHIEAGLRTGHIYSPWPEEVHRCLIDRLSTYFFAPTEQARMNLLQEAVLDEKIWVVGNTAIDAVRMHRNAEIKAFGKFKTNQAPSIVVTVHRRENHGDALQRICKALLIIAQQFPHINIIFFLHPNPNVRSLAQQMLSNIPNINLSEPLNHPSFIQVLEECKFIMTDSGGIQEEMPFMGKPVLIMRDTTERPEGILAGTAKLVGTDTETIVASCKELLENPFLLEAMSKVHFPYGDGYTAKRIVDILETELVKNKKETGSMKIGDVIS